MADDTNNLALKSENSEGLPPENAEQEQQTEESTETSGESASPSAETAALEQEARQSGWVAKQEWVDQHGSEKGWKSAEDYIDFRRNFLPIVTRENKELRAKIAALEAKETQREAQQREAKVSTDRQILRAQMRQAREDGDWDKVDEITDQLFDLKVAEKTPPVAAKTAPPVDPEVQRDFLEFTARNPWVKTDQRLAKIFAVELKNVMEAGIAESYPEAFEEARDRMRRLYPEKFPTTRRTSMAESGGERGAGKNGSRSWNDLKPEVKAEYEKFLEDTPKVKREELVKRFPAEYFRT
jgi:hypothetical protein